MYAHLLLLNQVKLVKIKLSVQSVLRSIGKRSLQCVVTLN